MKNLNNHFKVELIHKIMIVGLCHNFNILDHMELYFIEVIANIKKIYNSIIDNNEFI